MNGSPFTRRELCEFDICLLKTFGGYKGCVVLIDCFTKYLWYCNIKSKLKPEVLKALKQIISQSGPFARSLSDGELIYTNDFWESKNTYYHALKKTQHPSFIEVAQRSIKQRIYSYLRQAHSSDWTKVIKGTTTKVSVI